VICFKQLLQIIINICYLQHLIVILRPNAYVGPLSFAFVSDRSFNVEAMACILSFSYSFSFTSIFITLFINDVKN
jgi:hypothetical protein